MSQPSSSGDSASFIERRNFPRRRPRGTASLIPAEKPLAPGTRVTLTNISQGGVGFVVTKALTLGQRVLLELQAPGPSRPLTVQAEVRWIFSDTKPGQFRVGCSWVERLQYHDLVHFV